MKPQLHRVSAITTLQFWSDHPDWQKQLQELWQAPLAKSAKDLQLTHSRSVEVRRTVLEFCRPPLVVWIKSFKVRGFRHALSLFLRGGFLGRSKAVREYFNLRHLHQKGIPCAVPVGAGEIRRAGFLLGSVIITQDVTDFVGLDMYLTQRCLVLQADAKHGKLELLIQRVAAFTREMHAAGFVHWDFYWRNLLVSREAEKVVVIDCPKGQIQGQLSDSDRAVDLACLDSAAPAVFTRSQRLRFFLAYRQVRRLSSVDKNLIRETQRLAAPQRELQTRRFRKRSSSVKVEEF